MAISVQVIMCILIGYLIGTVNPSYFLARLRGMDIRKEGSRNAGASNALIMMGKLVGVLCALADIAKPCLAIWITTCLFPSFALAEVITGVACIIGHIFPFYLGFRGGKGLACLGGVVLMSDARVFACLLIFEIILALVTDYICVVPITASIIFPITYGLMNQSLAGALILTIASVIMILKHRENLHRIRKGTEMRLSYLWRGEQEIERIRENLHQ